MYPPSPERYMPPLKRHFAGYVTSNASIPRIVGSAMVVLSVFAGALDGAFPAALSADICARPGEPKHANANSTAKEAPTLDRAIHERGVSTLLRQKIIGKNGQLARYENGSVGELGGSLTGSISSCDWSADGNTTSRTFST